LEGKRGAGLESLDRGGRGFKRADQNFSLRTGRVKALTQERLEGVPARGKLPRGKKFNR